ncbi:protease IV [Vibrio cholerae]|nr:protease IV [Vibrio cholerae]
MDKSSALVLNLSGPIVEQSTHINPCCLILLKPYAMRKMTTMSPGLCWL